MAEGLPPPSSLTLKTKPILVSLWGSFSFFCVVVSSRCSVVAGSRAPYPRAMCCWLWLLLGVGAGDAPTVAACVLVEGLG